MKHQIQRNTQSQPSHTVRALLLVVLALATGLSTATAGQSGLEVILVMDSSGSMKNTDEGRARIAVARQLPEVLGSNDQAAVVSFSDEGYPLVSFTPASGAEDLHRAIDKISSKGMYSNIPDALTTAADIFLEKGNPKNRRTIILMSDGIIDLQDEETTFAFTQRLLQELIPELKKRKIRVFALSFTDDANNALLRILAEDTGGAFYVMSSGQNAGPLLQRIVEQARAPAGPVLKEKTLRVAAGTRETFIIIPANKEADEFFLESPLGETFTYGIRGGRVQWRRIGKQVVARITKPYAGRWRVAYEHPGSIDTVNNIALHAEVSGADLITGAELRLKARLTAESRKTELPRFLWPESVIADIKAADGSSARLTLNDDGIVGDERAGDGVFTSALVFNIPGRYRLKVAAKNGLLQQGKTLELQVAPPPFEPPPEPAEAPLDMAAGQALPSPAHDQMPDNAQVGDTDNATQAHSDEPAEEDSQEANDGSGGALWIGIVLLLLAAIGSGGLFWFWKTKMKPSQKSAEAPPGENPEPDAEEATDSSAEDQTEAAGEVNDNEADETTPNAAAG